MIILITIAPLLGVMGQSLRYADVIEFYTVELSPNTNKFYRYTHRKNNSC